MKKPANDITPENTEATPVPEVEAPKKKTLKFKKTKVVAVEQFKPKVDVEFYVRIVSKIEEGEPLENATRKKMKPPMIGSIINLENEREYTLIFPSILYSEIMDNYPDDSYLDRTFVLMRQAKRESAGGGGQSYSPYNITEILLDGEEEKAPPPKLDKVTGEIIYPSLDTQSGEYAYNTKLTSEKERDAAIKAYNEHKAKEKAKGADDHDDDVAF